MAVETPAELVRRLAAEVEEDEGIHASVCHLGFVEELRGPLADRLAPFVREAVDQADRPRAHALAQGYWELVDAAEATAGGVASLLDEARRYLERYAAP